MIQPEFMTFTSYLDLEDDIEERQKDIRFLPKLYRRQKKFENKILDVFKVARLHHGHGGYNNILFTLTREFWARHQ